MIGGVLQNDDREGGDACVLSGEQEAVADPPCLRVRFAAVGCRPLKAGCAQQKRAAPKGGPILGLISDRGQIRKSPPAITTTPLNEIAVSITLSSLVSAKR